MSIPRETLCAALAAAETKLREATINESMARAVADERQNCPYESMVQTVMEAAFKDTCPELDVRQEWQAVDVAGLQGGKFFVAMELKGMVANAVNGRPHATWQDRSGISSKLVSVDQDMSNIGRKARPASPDGCWQVFLPIVYELYREDGPYRSSSPWTTPPGYMLRYRKLEEELKAWFAQPGRPACDFLYGTKSHIPLTNANEHWLAQRLPEHLQIKSLAAFVSFFAFARFA